MKYKLLKHILCLVLAAILTIGPLASMGYEYTGTMQSNNECIRFISDGNEYIKYYINQTTGGFYILPASVDFDDSSPESFAMFEINGAEYRFGTVNPGENSYFIPPFINSTGTAQCTWRIGDYTITQYINIIAEDGVEGSYAAYIGYETELSGEPVTLKTRMIIDTVFGENDDQPVMVSGYGPYVTNEKIFMGTPQYFQTDENISNKPIAYGYMTDDRFASPVSVTLAHFENLLNGGFDYEPDALLDFTSPNNKYGCPDSGVALDFAADNGVKPVGVIIGFRCEVINQDAVQPIMAASLSMEISAASAQLSFASEKGSPNDGINFDDLFAANRWIYYGAKDHYTGSAAPFYDGAVTPVLWRVMGEEWTDDGGDGAITLFSEFVTDVGTYNNINITLGNMESDDFNSGELKNIKDTEVNYPDVSTKKLYLPWGFVNDDDASVLSVDAAHLTDLTESGLNNLTLPIDINVNNPYGTVYANPNLVAYTKSEYRGTAPGYFLNPRPWTYWLRDTIEPGSPSTALHTGRGYSGEDPGAIYRVASIYDQGVRPVFKLNPENIILAQEITESGGIDFTTIASDSVNYWIPDFVENANGKLYKLTVVDENVGELDGFTTTGTGEHILELLPDDPEFAVFENISATLGDIAGDHDDYTINYKIVGENENTSERDIIMYSSQAVKATDNTISIPTIDLESEESYSVYIWLQKNNEVNSNEASEPVYFELTVRRGYEILTDFQAPASLTINPEKTLYLPGETITLKNITNIPENYKSIINIYGESNGQTTNVALTDKNNGTYIFIMPSSTATVSLSYYPKAARLIYVEQTYETETSPVGKANLTLDKQAAMPGETVNVTFQQIQQKYYVSYVKGFAADDLLNPIFNIDLTGSRTGSFTLPTDFPETDIVLRMTIAETPKNNIVVAPVNLSYIDNNYGGYYSRDFNVQINKGADDSWMLAQTAAGAGMLNSSNLPGNTVTFEIASNSPYWGFDIESIKLAGNNFANYTESVTSAGGKYSSTVKIVLPNFNVISDFIQGNITISLIPKRIYKPYSITSVTPDSGAYTNATKLTVSGSGFEQTEGRGIDYDLLDATEKAIINGEIYFGYPDNLIKLDPADITISQDGTSMTINLAAVKTIIGAEPTGGSDFILKIGSLTRTVLLDTDYRLRYTPFSVLGAVSQPNGSYRIELADNDADLLKRAAGQTIVMKIKGEVTASSSGVYKFETPGQVVMINNALTYTICAGGSLTVSQAGDSVTLTGTGGDLAVPGFKFGSNAAISSEMTYGVIYDTQNYRDDGDEIKNITVSWAYAGSGILDFALDFGLGAKINAFKLIDSNVIFGGSLSVGIPFASQPFLGIDIKRLQYEADANSGQFIFKGVEANGSAGWPDDLSLGDFMNMGNSVKAYVNTFTGDYKFDVNAGIQLINFEGRLYLKQTSIGLVPDEFNIYISGSPGVPIIPSIPVATLKGGGGGMTGIADTLTGNFDRIPPIRLNLQAQIDFAEFLSINRAELSIGPSGISIKGNPIIKIPETDLKLEPFTKFGASLDISTKKIEINAAVEAAFIPQFPVFIVGGEMYIGYEFPTSGSIINWKNLKFSGRLYGKVQVPRIEFDVGLFSVGIGPVTLLQREVGISNEGLWSTANICGFDIRLSYKWGAALPTVSRSAAMFPQAGQSLETKQEVFGDDGAYQGTLSAGSNLKLVSSSATGIRPLRMSSGGQQEITIGENQFAIVNLPKNKITVFKSNDGGATFTVPVILYYPASNTESEMNAQNINAVDFSTDTENSVMLNLGVGSWMVKSTDGSDFDCAVIEATPQPKLTAVELNGADMTWTAQNLDAGISYVLDIFLSPDDGNRVNHDMGVLLKENVAITGNSGTIQNILNDLPSDLPSGNYYVWAYLKSVKPDIFDPSIKIYESFSFLCDSQNAYAHINAFTPKANSVDDYDVNSIGSGNLLANWTNNSGDDDVYYFIEVFDKDGNPVMMDSTPDFSEKNGDTQNLDASMIPVTFTVSPADAVNNNFTAVISGLPTGEKYNISVTPYRYTGVDTLLETDFEEEPENKEFQIKPVFGNPTVINNVLLQIPTYPSLSVLLEDAVSIADETGVSVFSAGDYKLKLAADTDVIFTVIINGDKTQPKYQSNVFENTAELTLGLTDGYACDYVQIIAIDADGDVSYYSYVYYKDDQKPVLFVDTDENGAVKINSDGSFNITGTTQPFATVSLLIPEAIVQKAKADGSFKLTGTTSYDSIPTGNDGNKLLTVLSSDFVGNTETANVAVVLYEKPNPDPKPNPTPDPAPDRNDTTEAASNDTTDIIEDTTKEPAKFPFTDVKEDAWYYGDVYSVWEHGLMIGTSENLFSPEMNLTRGMLVTILYRHAGSPDITEFANPFDDVAEDKYYTNAVKWAAANGIIFGYGNGLFGPEDSVTRQDLAVILYRYAAINGWTLPVKYDYLEFNDGADIANYAKKAIEQFFKTGIINGYPDGSVKPKNNATRAEVAAMIKRFMTTIEKEK